MNFEIKDLTGLGAPITKLIEVISNGIGVLYKPYSIRKEADASAYAAKLIGSTVTSVDAEKLKIIGLAQAANNIVLADTDRNILDRAKARIVYRELQRQTNIEAIAEVAIKELPDHVSTDKVDGDWRTRFFDIAENVSNSDMQALWGKVLAGEVAKPGSYSLRALDVLRNLTQHEAHLFQLARGMAFANRFILKINSSSSFDKYGLTYTALLELRNAGIIHEGDLLTATFKIDPADHQAIIQHNELWILITSPTEPEVMFETVTLTSSAMELISLIEPSANMLYLNDLALSMKPKGFSFQYIKSSERPNDNDERYKELGIDESSTDQ
ncbi:MAG: DUF2806 domain-containing protein [Candidatus Nitrotoga sp.]|nr:DUF2806 domain-containing protein [Candidatus Nitrotoga sp.]